tara:strand:+ start:1375 stop:5913 length:4539 start_codon:yes stop_codon:yes gene_type:complete
LSGAPPPPPGYALDNAPRKPGTLARARSKQMPPPPPPGFALEASGAVVDGDTIRLQDGNTARGYGFDAFERKQAGTINGQPVRLGELAKIALDNAVTPQTVITSTGKASFGRPVASFANGGSDLGRSQIAGGLALPALDYLGQDPERGQDYVAAQREAIGAEAGAYAGQFQEPAAFRKQGDAAPVVGKIPMQPDEYSEYATLLRDSRTTPEQLQQWAVTKGRNIANAPELLSFMRRNPKAIVSQYWQQEDVQGAPVVKDGQNIATRHMGALNEGIVDTLGAPVDLMNMGLGAVGVPVSDKPLLGSSMIRDGFHALGFGQIDESTAPRSDIERYTQSFARGTGQAVVPIGGSIGLGGRLANRAPSLATRASPTRQAVRTSLVDAAKMPAATAAAELGGATGANVAGEFANDVAPGNVYAQLGAQTLGGLGGGFGGFKAFPARPAAPRLPASSMADNAPDTAPVSVAGDVPPPPPGFTLEQTPAGAMASDTGLADASMRLRDVIDVNRTRPLLQAPTEAQIAASAQNIRPDDLLPMPSNRIDGPDGADAIQAGRYDAVKPVDERSLLEGRAFQSQRNPENYLNHKGPMDLVSWVRARGGLVDDGGTAATKGGDLTAMGMNNGPRQMDFAQNDVRMGPLINNEGGSSLDDMAQRAWEEGFFPDHIERPTVDEFLEAMGDTHSGSNRRFMQDDFEEVDRFYSQQDQNWKIAQAEDQGAPMVADRSEPAGEEHLGPRPDTAYQDWPAETGGRVGNINVDKLDSPQAITRALKASHDAVGGFDPATRGVVTHEATARLASDLGMTADQLLTRRKGQALNAEEALAARQILARSGNEMVNIAKRVKNAGDNPGDELLAEFRQAWVRHVAIQEQVSGATAEAGRTLQAFRIAADSRDAPANVLRGLVGSAGGGQRIQDAADAILDLAEDPGKLNRFTEKALKPGFKDMAVELWYNFLLSGPQTHVVNMTSNTLTALAQLPEHAVAATLGGARRAFNAQASDRVLFSELGARSVGLLQGTKEGLRQMVRTFRTGEPSDAVTKVEDLAQKAIPGKIGEVLRVPTRALTAEDELFKAMARRMELSGLAVRQAGKEGLKGQAAKDRVAELLNNPPDEMLQQSFDYGRYLTFTKPLSEKDGALSALGSMASRATQVVPALKAILPFVRTPTNLIKFSIERSPLAPAMKDWRRDFAAGGARRDLAVARAMVGSGIGALMAQYAAEGKITGSPPSDKAKERLLRADGWQPYSFKVGDKYYSYLRLDPFASTIGTAADIATMNNGMTDKQRADGATLTVASILSNLGSKTWLSGITDALAALDDPERNSEWFLKRLAGSAAVPTGVAQAARYMDPTFREADTAGDYIQSRIPGMGASLPSKRDFWGQPIVGEGGLGPDAISPIWQSTRRNDPATNELLRVGVRSGPPQRKEMTGHEYADFQERAGTMAKASIGALIQTPQYRAMSNDEKEKIIKDIISDTRREAKKTMASPKAPVSALPPAARQGRLVPALRSGNIPPPPPGFRLEGQ